MHHAYMENQEEIIAMLKEAGFKKRDRRDNLGRLPEQCRHKQFSPDSDAEFTDDDDQAEEESCHEEMTQEMIQRTITK